jgi:hypothetical protein
LGQYRLDPFNILSKTGEIALIVFLQIIHKLEKPQHEEPPCNEESETEEQQAQGMVHCLLLSVPPFRDIFSSLTCRTCLEMRELG